MDGQLPEASLQLLAEDRARREAEVNSLVHESMAKHRAWNSGWIDQTWRPITPPLESGTRSSFRTAVTESLPTPPASSSAESGDEPVSKRPALMPGNIQKLPFRYASPPMEVTAPTPSYRRRVGRGGRLFIDRRGVSRNQAPPSPAVDDRIMERMEYDVESDEEPQVFYSDKYDSWNMRYRTSFAVPSARDANQHQRMIEEARRTQALQQQQQGNMANGVKGHASGQAATAPPAQKAST
jgi:enhancer of polycomb-like protein